MPLACAHLSTHAAWQAGGYFVNSFFVGTISESKTFVVEHRGPLDYGQYYAARTGTGRDASARDGRRVLVSATGWHNPPGWPDPPKCRTQMHLIPRDLALDSFGRLTFHPIPELTTLHIGEKPAVVVVRGGDDRGWVPSLATPGLPSGSALELRLNCSGGVGGVARASANGYVGFDLLSDESRTSFVRVAYSLSGQQLQVDHTHGGGADAGITQTAPLQLDASEPIEMVVLLDGALLEVFLNRRVVLSSFATHVFGKPQPAPALRSNFVLTPPNGIECVAHAWQMRRLTPVAGRVHGRGGDRSTLSRRAPHAHTRHTHMGSAFDMK